MTYHLIGIGGIGMSALARILLQRGVKVSGSDVSPSLITEALIKEGAEVFFGHSGAHIRNKSTVVYSTDIRSENPEIQAALAQNVPLIHRSDLLSDLMQGSSPLLVAGAHGKTTTSSLLTHLLIEAGLKPSYAIGGVLGNLQSNGGSGSGPYFVAEADESDGSFLKYSGSGAIITNVDEDHLDYWKDEKSLINGFSQFAQRLRGDQLFFWCGDDEILRGLSLQGFSYGFSDQNALHIESFCQFGWKSSFEFFFHKKRYSQIELPLIGAHNVLNGAAVFGMGIQLGLSEEKIRKALLSFKGVNRRAEWKGESNGISIFDDYAHHPTEIFATLRAIRQAVHKQRLVVAFQPHRYTRTLHCMNEFGPAFECADVLILTDIFAAREEPIENVSARTLLRKIQEHSSIDSHYSPRGELSTFLFKFLRPDDVLVTMGAGDITSVGAEVLQNLNTFSPLGNGLGCTKSSQ